MKKMISILLCLALVFATSTVTMAKPYSSSEWVYGDVDFDGRITAGDALWMLLFKPHFALLIYSLDPNCHPRWIYESTVESEPHFFLYDVNLDYEVDARDALLVLQYSVGLVHSFPADKMPLPPH